MLADACDVESGMEDIDEARREQASEDESDSMDIDDKDQGKASYTIKELVYGREIDEGFERAGYSAVDADIDESHVGEPWVQGLMEGEYSDLSVQERLNALVALVEAVNEGNTIRMALEVIISVHEMYIQVFSFFLTSSSSSSSVTSRCDIFCMIYAGSHGSCNCLKEANVGRRATRQTALQRRARI
jgi:hypothetical protein